MQLRNRFTPVPVQRDVPSPAVTKLLASAKPDICVETEDCLGDVRYSDNQPKFYGHPFVVHLTQKGYRQLTSLVRERIKQGQVEVSECFPAFLKTEEPLVRLRFNNGAKEAALWLVQIAQDHGLKFYKNWTDSQKLER
jgi:hypothetical protein